MVEKSPRRILISIGGSPDNLVAEIMVPNERIEKVEVDSHDFEQVAADLGLDLPEPGDYTRAFELKAFQLKEEEP